MNILIGCEFSGIVRKAFRDAGHNAWSNDIIPAEDNSLYHLQCDIRDILDMGWDMLIVFPPCTYLAGSGARWWSTRQKEQLEALDFVRMLLNAPIHHIALENPVGKISTSIRKPDQIVHPYHFGHTESKATCLWLKNLPKLVHTEVMQTRNQSLWRLPPSENRGKLRSITFQGIANAMANQWGKVRCPTVRE